jgi:hypothetical protein
LSWYDRATETIYAKQIVIRHDREVDQKILLKASMFWREVGRSMAPVVACQLLRVTDLDIVGEPCFFSYAEFLPKGCSLSNNADPLLLSLCILTGVATIVAFLYCNIFCDIDDRILAIFEEREDIL